ncbi:MAG TPA: carbamoyltransferase HypF, partial [Anaeromyxobacteraceae bacterium]|nr:carbamoyltransferase HypF [Anaeromyxobacteraceae bacterium]
VVRRMVAAGVNAPRAHGAGRIFDVVGALALGRGVARHEGQLAVALDGLADEAAEGTYPFAVDTSATPWQLDWRPTVRAAARDALAGVPAGVLSMRFHRALAEGAAELLRLAGRQVGRLPVVATGGVFQNGLLAALLEERIRGGFDVYLPGRVPPGDGGIALGQAVVASTVAST